MTGSNLPIPIIAYADDLKIMASSYEEALQIFELLTKWCEHVNMRINPKKSFFSHTSRNSQDTFAPPAWKNTPINYFSLPRKFQRPRHIDEPQSRFFSPIQKNC